MLKLKNIKKVYNLGKDNTVKALKDINLKFRKSEFVSILGPSGCGKTTLLNIIGGLDKATKGDLIVDNQSTKEYTSQDWDNYRNKKIGFVFQSYNLIPHQTILRNVELSLTLTGMKKEQRQEQAIEVLKKVGLGDQIYKKPNQLSGGQMQRVAIARALVNNPDIILADEPTGALDSESGHQVLSLLKEVANDRLVIMVTHNEGLADSFSTRIIKLKDGKMVYDSKPFEASSQPKKAVKTKKSKKKKLSMSYWTAFSLSINNLMSKKGRSMLTAVAGSIGIIGISLVLALSAGVNIYIETIEKDALSLYPLEVNETTMPLSSILSLLTEETEDRPSHPDTENVYTKVVLGNVVSNLSEMISTNDLEAFKVYVDENFDDSLGYVKYDYGVGFNVYCNYVEDEEKYMKVNPFLDGMEEVLGDNPLLQNMGIFDELEQFAQHLSIWDEMIDNQGILNQQYELLGQSRWPSDKDEVVIVLDEKNQIDDFALLALGLIPPDEVMDVFSGETDYNFTIDDLMDIEYELLSNADYYHYDENSDMWSKHSSRKRDIDFVENSSLNVKVVGVIRPKKGAVTTSINGIVGYNSKLTEHMMQKAEDHPAVMAQNQSDNDIIVSEDLSPSERLYEMGVADINKPRSIHLYAYSFDAKDEIINLIEEYNDTSDKSIKYSDNLSIIMGFVDTFTKTVTGVLIGFSAISLIVSSIMIAIIVYTSVLERKKEIGVLRSLGARKKDVSNVFFAESATLGFVAGIFGILVTLLLTIPINIILSMVFSVNGLVAVQWWHAVMMISISLILSIIAGFTPSRLAAKQDPVKALRAE